MHREGPLIILINPDDEQPTPFDTGFRCAIDDYGFCILMFPSHADAAKNLQLIADYFTAAAKQSEPVTP